MSMIRLTLWGCLLILIMHGCAENDDTRLTGPIIPAFSLIYGSDCPPNAPWCRGGNEGEKEWTRNIISTYLNAEADPDCANARQYLLDALDNGKFFVFGDHKNPSTGKWVRGFWNTDDEWGLAEGYFNANSSDPYWGSYRMGWTSAHEGGHHHYWGGAEEQANEFADMCIDY